MGLFQRIKEGLKKTKESFGKKIFELFKGRALDDEFYDDLETAMIASDMGVTAAENVIEELKDAVYKKKITDPELAKNELKRIMLESIDYEIPPYEYPLVILIAGVNGVGKTTAVGKLAKLFVNMGKSVTVAAADTFRAAAGEQLEVWAERAGVRIVKHGEGSDPLMEELKKINRVIDREAPDFDKRSYIVLDATTGQNAVSQVEIFSDAIDADGIILTKLDGTAKGGVVLAVSAEYEIPVVYAGIGEKIDDLIPFDAKEFIDGIFE